MNIHLDLQKVPLRLVSRRLRSNIKRKGAISKKHHLLSLVLF